MELNERQYERLARWLDGQAVELTDEERAAAEEIRRDGRAVGRLLDVPIAAEALDRRLRPPTAKVLRGRTLPWRYVAESMAAAAVLVLTYVVALSQPPSRETPRVTAVPMSSDELFNEVLGPPKDVGIDLLSHSIDEFNSDLVMTEMPWSIDGQGAVDNLQRNVDDLLLDPG